MQLPLTSRRPWRLALLLPAIALTAALWLTFVPPAHAQEGPPAGQSKRGLTPERVGANLPPKGCQSKWCQRVRVTHRIAHRLLTGLQRWERAGGNVSPLSDMDVLLDIVRATRAENRSPFLLVAISGKESSFGTAYSCRSPNGDGAGRYNLTGLASCWAPDNWKTITLCGKTINGAAYVTSYARGMRLTARLIRCLLPSARTVYELNGYAASSTWKPAVHSIMVDVFRVPDHVMWQDAVRATR